MSILKNKIRATCVFQGAITFDEPLYVAAVTDIDIGVFDPDGDPSELDGFISFSLEIDKHRYSTASPLILGSFVVGSTGELSTIGSSTWYGGTAENFTFSLSGTDTNINLQGNGTKKLWAVLYGQTANGRVIVSSGEITAVNSGVGSGAPYATPSLYYTSTEVDALISGLAGVSVPTLPRLYGTAIANDADYAMVYDASTGLHKKVLMEEWGGPPDNSDHYYITASGDGNGLGTQQHPWVCDTPSKLATKLQTDIPEGSTVHFSADTFNVGTGLSFNRSLHLVGADRYATVFALGTGLADGGDYAIFRVNYSATTNPDYISFRNMTLDAQYQGSTGTNYSCGALTVFGKEALVQNCDVVNCGNTKSAEAFYVSLFSQAASNPVHGVIENVHFYDDRTPYGKSSTALMVGAQTYLGSDGDSQGSVRNCVVERRNGVCVGISRTTKGVLIENNYLSVGSGGYGVLWDTWDAWNCRVINNDIVGSTINPDTPLMILGYQSGSTTYTGGRNLEVSGNRFYTQFGGRTTGGNKQRCIRVDGHVQGRFFNNWFLGKTGQTPPSAVSGGAISFTIGTGCSCVVHDNFYDHRWYTGVTDGAQESASVASKWNNQPIGTTYTNYSHVDHSAVSITVGTGLTGGGTIGTSMTIAVSFGTTYATATRGDDGRLSDRRQPTGAASGDLGGTYPNPSVDKIRGYSVGTTAPQDNYVLTWVASGSSWVPQPAAAAGTAGTPSYVNSVSTGGADFNDSVPAAPAGGVNVKWQLTGSAIGSASAYVDVAEVEIIAAVANLSDYDPNRWIDHTGVSMIAGTGLSGGGNIGTSRTFDVAFGTTSATVMRGDDGRVTGPREPTAHAATHESGGTDEILLSNLDGYVANEHIDHSTVSIIAGTALLNGGTIGTSLRLDVDYTTLDSRYAQDSYEASLSNSTPAAPSTGVNITWQETGASPNVISGYVNAPDLHSKLDHDSLSGFVANEHINHANITIGTGTGIDITGDLVTGFTASLKGSYIGQFDASTPAAPVGTGINVIWQETGGGPVTISAYIPIGTTSSTVAVGNDRRFIPIGTTAPGDGQVLAWSAAGTAYVPTTVSGTGDMVKSTYDANNDGIINASAGGLGRNASSFNGMLHMQAGSATVALAGTHYALGTITISAGTGLTGGGSLAANRSIHANFGTTSTTIMVGNDWRVGGSAGTAGGGLSGSYPNPTVVSLRGYGIGTTTPTTGSVFRFDGTGWAVASESSFYLTKATFDSNDDDLIDSNAGGLGVDASSFNGVVFMQGGVASVALAGTHYALGTISMTAGTGLLGGGTLAATRRFDVNFGTSQGTVAEGNDPRLTRETFVLAASDETTALTTGTGKVQFVSPWAWSIDSVRATVNTAPTGADIVVDVNKNGSSIFSSGTTLLRIDATELTSATAGTAYIIAGTSIADGDVIRVDIDNVGATIAGAGLKIYLTGHRP